MNPSRTATLSLLDSVAFRAKLPDLDRLAFPFASDLKRPIHMTDQGEFRATAISTLEIAYALTGNVLNPLTATSAAKNRTPPRGLSPSYHTLSRGGGLRLRLNKLMTP